MKNMIYLVIAALLFALAYYIYWVVGQENAAMIGGPRSISPQAVPAAGIPPSAFMSFVQQWQPVLTLVSSLGGIVSFIIQVRVWVRGRS